ncbi:hypothetical protein [Caballeronia sp. LZ035]|uniref:hypothetical protein n=1 Tax=Caballeronia sp. LZ035 TaxID=3038568 RepID=UPI0028617B69|nr:hypothetical protein [Caballeronia sp. LZ035]MDR5763406.1 hypothetical protein [Caballeronia sp. LZ035]
MIASDGGIARCQQSWCQNFPDLLACTDPMRQGHGFPLNKSAKATTHMIASTATNTYRLSAGSDGNCRKRDAIKTPRRLRGTEVIEQGDDLRQGCAAHVAANQRGDEQLLLQRPRKGCRPEARKNRCNAVMGREPKDDQIDRTRRRSFVVASMQIKSANAMNNDVEPRTLVSST